MQAQSEGQMAKYKRNRRTYFALCMCCLGSGSQAIKDGTRRQCVECLGKCEVERFLIEWVHDETETEVSG